MIITIPWLKEHLQTKANESNIIDRLTNIRLEVENVKESQGGLENYLGILSTGQWLSIPFMIIGLVLLIRSNFNKI